MTAGRICSLGELQDFSLVVHGIPCKLLNAQLQLGLGCALSYWLLLQHVRLHFGHSLVVKNPVLQCPVRMWYAGGQLQKLKSTGSLQGAQP